jgi:WD40 repeat protein
MKRSIHLFACVSLILAVYALSRAQKLEVQKPELQKPELVVQKGHADEIHKVAFSPDGKTLVSMDHRQITLWDTVSGYEMRNIMSPSGIVSFEFSPDGKTLATGHGDNKVRLWDVITGSELRSFSGHSGGKPSPFKPEYNGVTLAFSPDGKTLASGGRDDLIKLWDIASGVELRSFSTSGYPHLIFSPNSKTLISAQDDNTVKFWDIDTGSELRAIKTPGSAVLSPDGRTFAISGNSHNKSFISLYDIATDQEWRIFEYSTKSTGVLAFSANSRTLASADNSSTARLIDVTTGKELQTFAGSGAINSLAFSPDGKRLASGDSRGTVRIWDIASGAQLHLLAPQSSSVMAIAFSPDSRLLARGGDDNTIKLWNLATGAELYNLTIDIPKFHWYGVSSLAFSPDGKMLASSYHSGVVRLWTVATGTELRQIVVSPDANDISVAFSPDGKILFTGDTNAGEIILWDVNTGEKRHSFKFERVRDFALSFDGSTLAVSSAEVCSSYQKLTSEALSYACGRISLWDTATGQELGAFTDTNHILHLSFSPDGRTLLGLSEISTIKLWDIAAKQELRTLRLHSNGQLRAFSQDGKLLAIADNGVVSIWELATGAELGVLNPHSGVIFSAVFSPDGKMLAIGGEDFIVKLWDVSTDSELASLISLNVSDWMVLTPDGFFDGSAAAWNKILWRFNNNTFNYAPVEAFFSDFYYPGLLQDIFAGKRPKAPSDISQKDRRQPQLKLTTTEAQADGALTARDVGRNPTVREGARNVTVKIDVAELAAHKGNKTGSGAQDVRLFRNGSLVKVWHGDVLKGQSSVTLEATIPIVAGENKLTAYAFNHDNIKSSDATLIVTGADSLKRAGTAYILAVGINDYSNSQYNLKYAVADAQDFSAEVKRQQELLKRYARVEVISLSDSAATKANITQKLEQLAARVQPEDAVIVYFAGHGTAQGKQFYLIPHDLGYSGPRENLSKAGLQTILDHSISDRELEKLFEGIDAGQLLLVIDACNSGQALEAEEKRRGPMNSKGLAQLAYEKGMYVLTAAQSYQAAQEAAKFGHGFLTYALVEEGLKQGAADREPKNGAIDLREWLNYATDEVPKMQEQDSLEALRGRGRYVVFVGDGSRSRDANKKDEARDNIQRPRLFYRRELDSNPLVVAVLGATTPQ